MKDVYFVMKVVTVLLSAGIGQMGQLYAIYVRPLAIKQSTTVRKKAMKERPLLYQKMRVMLQFNTKMKGCFIYVIQSFKKWKLLCAMTAQLIIYQNPTMMKAQEDLGTCMDPVECLQQMKIPGRS